VINSDVAVSDVAGSASAITRLQQEPQRYFQRTDTPEVSFNPSRTSLRGWTGHVNLNRNEGAWQINASVWGTSPGFDSSDLGFHCNGDAWGEHVALNWRQLHPDKFTRDRNILIAKFSTWNYGGAKLSDGFMVISNLTFLNYWNMGGNLGIFRKGQDDRL